ncbi:MAG: YciE/YciF ferroxidase family protein [Solirubrobacteraceae bacterium]
MLALSARTITADTDPQPQEEPQMFEQFHTPEEIFDFKLGAALTMEQKLIDVLEEFEEHAQRPEIKHALATHRQETTGHVTNLEECFRLLGEEIDDSPCPTIEAMAKEGKATIKKTDDALVDAVILTAAGESEHHEIAVYEALIPNAEARGATQVASLLRENLAQEKHALQIASEAMEKIAREGIAVAG